MNIEMIKIYLQVLMTPSSSEIVFVLNIVIFNESITDRPTDGQTDGQKCEDASKKEKKKLNGQ